jgi:endonuclease-3
VARKARAEGGRRRVALSGGRTAATRGRRGAAARPRLGRIADILEREFGRVKETTRSDVVGGLVRTILSQNTTDANSGGSYLALRERFRSWGDVARADVRSVEAAIRQGGLARVKARRIKHILSEIEQERGVIDLRFLRGMPTAAVLEYLERFHGVGRKTSACVALFDLGRDVMPVDTHVHRVVGRLGVVGHPRDRDATFDALEGIAPRGRSLSLHVNLIRLGRTVCRSRRPACERCPVKAECNIGRGTRTRKPGR